MSNINKRVQERLICENCGGVFTAWERKDKPRFCPECRGKNKRQERKQGNWRQTLAWEQEDKTQTEPLLTAEYHGVVECTNCGLFFRCWLDPDTLLWAIVTTPVNAWNPPWKREFKYKEVECPECPEHPALNEGGMV